MIRNLMETWKETGGDLVATADRVGRTPKSVMKALRYRGIPQSEIRRLLTRKGDRVLVAWRETGGDLDLTAARLGLTRAQVAGRLAKRGVKVSIMGPVPPCATCGTAEGYASRHQGRPERIKLSRFGLEGKACRHCYQRLKSRQVRGANLSPEVPSLRGVLDGQFRAAWDESGHDVLAAARLLDRDPKEVMRSLALRGLPYDRPKRAEVPILPCAVCGDPGGLAGTGMTRPMRSRGERYGIAGQLCCTCDQRLRMRKKKGQPLDAPSRRGPCRLPVAPCSLCGDPAGHPRFRGGQRPLRASGTPYGLPGHLCATCLYRVRYRVRHGIDVLAPLMNRKVQP